MKRLALVAAVLAIAACTTKKAEPAADTSKASMAPAADTGMKKDSAMQMSADTGMKKMADSTKKKP